MRNITIISGRYIEREQRVIGRKSPEDEERKRKEEGKT